MPAAQPSDRNLNPAERAAPAAGPASVSSLLSAPRRALVIGNGSYGFGPLKNPANDARAIAEELKRIGFEVQAHEFPEGQATTAARKLPSGEVLLVAGGFADELAIAPVLLGGICWRWRR